MNMTNFNKYTIILVTCIFYFALAVSADIGVPRYCQSVDKAKEEVDICAAESGMKNFEKEINTLKNY